jgi:hypothetical protein
MAGYVNVRAYAELNDFLGPESRGLTVRRPFRPHQTVKDVLEAMGIPHTEVDLILVNGDAEDFAHARCCSPSINRSRSRLTRPASTRGK